jgi:predicted thioesterase
MSNDIKPGIKLSSELIVDESKSAKIFGSGMVDVFATPAMIALMEKTAMESVLPLLEEGYTTVGTEVHIKHLKATPIGDKVTCDSRLREVNGRKLMFELHAWDSKGMIGIGTHTRVIVEEKGFMENLK